MSLVVTSKTPVGELWTRHVFVFLGTSKSINSACKQVCEVSILSECKVVKKKKKKKSNAACELS